MRLASHIPNILTLSNLAAGMFGITFALDGNLEYAAFCIWTGAIFDFFDGFAARMLHVSSPIGKELDSLADMVTFGALPSLMMFQMVRDLATPWHYVPFLIALFSALRLAKFNIDTRQEEAFIGLPTPACALFVSALQFVTAPYDTFLTSTALLSISVVLALMLVAPIKLFSLKFKNFGWKNNQIRYIFVALSLALLIVGKIPAITLVIVAYILLSILNLITAK